MAAKTGKGETPVRSVRCADDPWVPARTIAERLGTNISAVIERALTEYVGLHKRELIEPGAYVLLEHTAGWATKRPERSKIGGTVELDEVGRRWVQGVDITVDESGSLPHGVRILEVEPPKPEAVAKRNHSMSETGRQPASLATMAFGGRKVGDLRYTAVGGGRGYQVWRGAKAVGKVMRVGRTWVAYGTDGKPVGNAGSMSGAGERLNKGDKS